MADVKDEVTVKLTVFECQRIVLALLNQNENLPGTGGVFLMKKLWEFQAAMIAKIDAAAEQVARRMTDGNA